MTGDIGRREPEERTADLWELPAVRSVEVRHARYAEPLRRYATARDVAEYPEAIEFQVETAAELPIRAIPPVLYVGDVMVAEFEQLDRERYVFRSFEPDSLPAGAPIALGWPRRADRRRSTEFRYEPPPEARRGRSR
jgi:hypothetical protein